MASIGIGSVVVCLMALLGVSGIGRPVTAEAPEAPNIVIFYLDDVARHDGRLWSDSTITPAIHQTFVAHGIEFTNAIGEDPLCCPARGNLLTGLHSHNNGLTTNDARLFNPQMHIGKALKNVGYASMWIGKYLNRNSSLSAKQWKQHMAGWSVFDGIYGFNGDYTKYWLRTKDQGDIWHGSYHSTKMVGDRAVMRMRQVPSDTPIFQVLSTYNLHGPNKPMPLPPGEYDKCDAMPPWWTPAFNEADVSDKPAYIRDAPLLRNTDGSVMTEGWPMVRYCTEMLGIDWLVKVVTDELAAQDRLDNTLLVFTADNGMTWGAHRRGQKKSTPYATPVPLYMAWPARWGIEPQTIREHTSNIDLAPTFCDIAGCSLGPYPTGQSGPDGVSLLGLIDGDVGNLGRDALLEWMVQWSAVRTTALHSLGLWHYVEYATGELELYDLETDAYELENLAYDPGYSDVVDALAERLAELRVEGATYRPDASISKLRDGPYKGDGVYADTPIMDQTSRRLNVRRNVSYDYFVRVENESGLADSLTIQASETGTTTAMHVNYLHGGVDITAEVAGSGMPVKLDAHAATILVVRFHVHSNAASGTVKRSIVRVTSGGSPGAVDVVRAVARR